MLAFGKTVSPATFRVPSASFHYEIAGIITDPDIRYANLKAPRAHAKSSIVAGIGPLWWVFVDAMESPTAKPEPRFVLILSKSLHHSSQLLRSIADVIEYSPYFRAIYGYQGRHNSASRFTQTSIELPNGSYLLARGMGQHIRGIKFRDMRPDLVIGDDFEDQENTKTEERLDGNWNWLHTEVIPAMNPSKHKFVNISTPQNGSCISVRLEKAPGWYNQTYHAILDDDVLNGVKTPYKEAALWPEWLPIEELLRKKTEMDSYGKGSYFFREYQCVITHDQERIFKPEYLRWWDGYLDYRSTVEGPRHFLNITHMDLKGLDKPLVLPVNVYGGIDPASSLSQSAAYSTIVTVCCDQRGNRYIMPYTRVRETPFEFGDKVISVYNGWGHTRMKIETVAYQEMLRQYIYEQRRVLIPGLENKYSPRQSKGERYLESLQPLMATGRLFLKSEGENQGMKEMRDEMFNFRPKGNFPKDLLDALYMAVQENTRPYHSIEDLDLPLAYEMEREQEEFDWMVE
jgi:hypothetical protein